MTIIGGVKMKKYLIILFSAILSCLMLFAFSGCGPELEDQEVPVALQESTEKEIISAYVASSKDPVTEEEVSLRCYAVFDGVYVLFVNANWSYAEVVTTDTVAGVKFVYSNAHEMTVYSDGDFYSLSEAYKNNILSKNDLLQLQKNYKSDHEFLYK